MLQPGAGEDGVHSADWQAPVGKIDISELLRIIQFFNIGGYYHCPDADPPTEDGYCPGVA